MSDPTPEMGMTVTPEMGLEVLERAKEAIYVAFEGQGDSPASAVSTAIVGYRNALAKITALESQIKLNMDYAALCKKREDTIGDLLAVTSRQRSELAAAPDTILRALDDYGGIEDKTDNPYGYEMLLHVAGKALAATEGKE